MQPLVDHGEDHRLGEADDQEAAPVENTIWRSGSVCTTCFAPASSSVTEVVLLALEARLRRPHHQEGDDDEDEARRVETRRRRRRPLRRSRRRRAGR